jgi:glucuronoarabinoxylan endo-1,4-beta-xylanase
MTDRSGSSAERRCGRVLAWVLAAAALHLACGREAIGATAIINAADERQIIRGFGGATVFRPTTPLTNADLDSLFGTGPDQIGFTLLRIRVAPDDEWRALELANALGAKARGASVIATPWSPPAAMKTNNSLIDGSLRPESYAAYASYLNDFASYMAANGAALYAISIQNEPDYVVTYESCNWTPAEMLDFCRNHAGAITAARVIAPESFQFRWNMSDPILNDAVASANVDIIGGHIYGGGLARYPLALAKGKEAWMTEYLELTTDWAGALNTAKDIHDCLAVADFSAFIWWYVKRYYGPLGEDGIVTKRGHVMAQFSKFIRPGYRRIAATESPAISTYVSAYKRDKLVIVAINLGTTAATQAFQLQNAAVNRVTPFITSASLSMAEQAPIALSLGSFTASLPAGSVTTFVGDLLFPAPVVVTPPRNVTVATGSTAVFSVDVAGEFPVFQWRRNGANLSGATSRELVIAGVRAEDSGSYDVVVSNSGGSATSAPATLAVVSTANGGRLVNLSARARAGTGNQVHIGGFVIGGSASREILVRAAGPALGGYGVTDVLVDPVVELHNQRTGALVGSNDDWDAALAPGFVQSGAFPWADSSKDAAILQTLAPGAYTAIARGDDGGSGVALVEIYDAGAGSSDVRLVNLSARSWVGAGNAVQIAGFVIGGSTAKSVVIRASGPALERTAGLTGVLADPIIDLRNQASGAVVASADDWDAALAPHFATVGAFAWEPGSKDAAIVTTLDPGSYTVVVRGRDGGTGIALVEVYELP